MASKNTMDYIKIIIDETAKGFKDKENYRIFNQEILTFKTLQEAKSYLSNKYSKCKRVKMYCDDKDGKPRQIGWIYCFNNKDISHNSEWWHQQDWVSIKEVSEKEITL